MAAAIASSSGASDINVTYEDQQKINRFARLNARQEEVRDELKAKQNDLQNIEDALNEVSIAELSDEAEDGVKILEGELFVNFSFEKATTWVEEKKATVEKEIEDLNKTIDTIKDEMNSLKVALYAKFGKDNINLESDD